MVGPTIAFDETGAEVDVQHRGSVVVRVARSFLFLYAHTWSDLALEEPGRFSLFFPFVVFLFSLSIDPFFPLSSPLLPSHPHSLTRVHSCTPVCPLFRRRTESTFEAINHVLHELKCPERLVIERREW